MNDKHVWLFTQYDSEGLSVVGLYETAEIAMTRSNMPGWTAITEDLYVNINDYMTSNLVKTRVIGDLS